MTFTVSSVGNARAELLLYWITFVILFTGEAGNRRSILTAGTTKVFSIAGRASVATCWIRLATSPFDSTSQTAKDCFCFRPLGHGRPYRFLGEFEYQNVHAQPGVPDTNGD